jgi:hypothetical protein
MRIIVIATLKTGNHWLKALLVSVFGLRQVDVDSYMTIDDYCMMPEDSVCHAHFELTEKALTKLRENNIVVVSIVRNPLDVLASFFYHVKTYADKRNIYNDRTWDILGDGEYPGKGLNEYVLSYKFAIDLRVSLVAKELGVPTARYEDLLSDPIAALGALLNEIEFESDCDSIMKAVVRSAPGVMKASRFVARDSHIRTAVAADWKRVLSNELVAAIVENEAYKDIFCRLGYTEYNQDVRPYDLSKLPPFYDYKCFLNSVPITDLIRATYFDFFRDNIDDIRVTCVGSFYYWLNERSQICKEVTMLAYALYSYRGDLQAAFPSVLHGRAGAFASWLEKYAENETGLPFELFLAKRGS